MSNQNKKILKDEEKDSSNKLEKASPEETFKAIIEALIKKAKKKEGK